LTDLSGEIGTKAIIGLDGFLTEGILGKILVPEALQYNYFLGQGGTVSGGGDKAKRLLGYFIRGNFFCQLCCSFLRCRQFGLYWCYFEDTGEISL
jgi:hypothetical protein